MCYMFARHPGWAGWSTLVLWPHLAVASMSQSTSHSTSQPTSQLASQPAIQPVSQPPSQLSCQPGNQPFIQAVFHSASQLARQSTSQTASQAVIYTASQPDRPCLPGQIGTEGAGQARSDSLGSQPENSGLCRPFTQTSPSATQQGAGTHNQMVLQFCQIDELACCSFLPPQFQFLQCLCNSLEPDQLIYVIQRESGNKQMWYFFIYFYF